jgi:acetyl-CoA carboxylase carboxyl transferase subunit alpha
LSDKIEEIRKVIKRQFPKPKIYSGLGNAQLNVAFPPPLSAEQIDSLMKQAERFGRPVLTLIDTPGAYPGIGAEERGQAEAIANNLYEMSGLRVPIVTCVTGEGGSGGALGIAVADRVFMLSNAIYSVISPEGCASILWKDTGRTAEAAEALRLTARDLEDLHVIDGIIPEPEPGAHEFPVETTRRLKKTLLHALRELLSLDAETLLQQRYMKFRNMGVFTTGGSSAI